MTGLLEKSPFLFTTQKGGRVKQGLEPSLLLVEKEFELTLISTMKKIPNHPELGVYFDHVDHTDIKTIEGEVDLRQFISGMLSYYPWWIVCLYWIREAMVRVLGLVRHEKPEKLPSIRPEDLAFQPGENATFFIVRAAKENAYWVSETPEDKHLTAYFGVVAELLNSRVTRFHVFTSVTYHHWTGPVYFNVIRPFHHLVVSCMMRNGVKQ